MTRATFSEPQQPVTIFQLSAVKYQYQICVHEEIIQPTEEEPNIQYVYDFAEFTETTEYLDPAEVEADPEAYLEYVPQGGEVHQEEPAESTIAQRIAEIEERQDLADEALQELIITVLGGE